MKRPHPAEWRDSVVERAALRREPDNTYRDTAPRSGYRLGDFIPPETLAKLKALIRANKR